MPTLLTTGLLAFGLCIVLTPLLRWFLLRSQPVTMIPRMGGLAVMAATALALVIPAWLHLHFAGHLNSILLRQLALPVGMVVLLGALDDHFNLAPRWKFAGQFAAAAVVMAQGIRVTAIFHHNLPFWLSALITLVWLVGCSNAFNLIDGLDGLATGLAMFATGTVLAHAVLIGNPEMALLTGVLFAALAGFLLFNFPPASIYLGDAGSLSIGFLLGCLALAWADKATTVVGLVAPLFALLVPVLDTLVSILRRGLTGQPLFAGDLLHIHHRLLRRGLTKRHAVLTLYAVAAAGGVASLLLADMKQRHTFELVILLFVVLAGVGIQQLGFVEFSEFGRMFRSGGLDPRKTLQAQMALHQWSTEVAAATGYTQIHASLLELGRALGFYGLDFRAGPAHQPLWATASAMANGADLVPATDFCGWYCQVPIGEGGALGFVRYWRTAEAGNPRVVDDLPATLQAGLAPRLAALNAASPVPSPSARAARVGGRS